MPDLRGGDLGGLRHRLDHDPLERALAQLPGEQLDQERALALGRPPPERGEQAPPLRLRARAAHLADGGECHIRLGNGHGRSRNRSGRFRDRPRVLAPGAQQVPERRVPDSDLALAQLAGQERHGERYFVGCRLRQQPGD